MGTAHAKKYLQIFCNEKVEELVIIIDYSKWTLRRGMKFQYKDDEGKTRLNSIITHVLKDKVQMALVDIDSQFQKVTEVDKGQLKWNPDNIQFIWDLERLTTFRELYNMLKIFSMEYIIEEWNNTLRDKDKDIFDVECIFDQAYVDSDLDCLLHALEGKDIKIQYKYG